MWKESKPNDRYPTRANHCTGWRDILALLGKKNCETNNADIDMICMGQKKGWQCFDYHYTIWRIDEQLFLLDFTFISMMLLRTWEIQSRWLFTYFLFRPWPKEAIDNSKKPGRRLSNQGRKFLPLGMVVGDSIKLKTYACNKHIIWVLFRRDSMHYYHSSTPWILCWFQEPT